MAGERRILLHDATLGGMRAWGGRKARSTSSSVYTAADRAWAEWIAWQLESERYTTVLQAWDFAPGENFVVRMRDALQQADRTIALLSEAYLASPYSTDEWTGAFLHDPSGQERLLPVRVEPFEVPRLLAARIYIDLAGVSRQAAKARLLAGVKQGPRPGRPDQEPPFPRQPAKGLEPQFPGQGPSITNLPRRNPNFTGRTQLLEDLRNNVRGSAGSAVTQADATDAISGLGGVGKTQLVLEYAHRYASDYDLIWWIGAEQPTTVVAALAELARRFAIEERPDQSEMVDALWDELRRRDRWLLVFDNAEQPEQLQPFLPPGGGGHVLVTSRWSAWGAWATPLRLDVLSRAEAVAFVLKRTGTNNEQAAAALAEALGDLPLALAEAAAYVEQTQIGLDEYVELVRDRAAELFGLDQPAWVERRVATVWSLSLEQVRVETPAAEALLALCAFLAPEDIPRNLPSEHSEVLPGELRQLAGDPLPYNRALGLFGRYSLATVTPTALGLHRLVQAVMQARLGHQAGRWAQVAVKLLDAAFPNQPWELATWPACRRLLPHVLAATGHAERLDVADEGTGWLLQRATTYLRSRGQLREARPLAERAVDLTQEALGPDDPEVGYRCDELGRVLRELGEHQAARQHLARALAIHENAYGADHENVGYRHSELGLALHELGDLTGARTEHQRALEIGQATLDSDDPELATRHSNLGSVLRELGDLTGARTELERAREIGQATLGPDHPNMAALHNNLGNVLRDLGDLAGARSEFEQALAIGEATLGPDHLNMAAGHNNLGTVLRALGDLAGARTEFERALEITEATLGPDHPTMATLRGNLDDVLRQLGDE